MSKQGSHSKSWGYAWCTDHPHTQTLPAKGFLINLFQQHNSIQFIIFFETFIEQQEQKEGSLTSFVSHFPYLPLDDEV